MNYLLFLNISTADCAKYFPVFKFLARIKYLVDSFLYYVLPLALIVIGIILLIKAIITKKEIKKAVIKLFRNIGLAVLIYISVAFINIILFSSGMCDLYVKDGVKYEDTMCCFKKAYK